MLRRDNSEYQWFRERAASIHTHLDQEYPVGDSTPISTMTTEKQNGSLNPEPAAPEDRAHEHLPPKSYADAAQEVVVGDSKNTNGHDYKHVNGNAKHSCSAEQSRAPSHDTNIGKRINDDKVKFEKYSDGNGSVLTSVKPDPSYEENLKHNRDTAPTSRDPSENPAERPEQEKISYQQDITKSQLKTGRQAGAGWERSAYVPITTNQQWGVLT